MDQERNAPAQAVYMQERNAPAHCVICKIIVSKNPALMIHYMYILCNGYTVRPMQRHARKTNVQGRILHCQYYQKRIIAANAHLFVIENI